MFGVLLLHSFGSTNLKFKEFEEHLQEQGFKTTVPLLPGHGTYPEDLENYTFEDWVQAGEKALSDLNCQGNFIIGEITGAPIALILASLHPELIGIVTLSGLISRPKWSTILNSLVKARSNMLPLASNTNPLID